MAIAGPRSDRAQPRPALFSRSSMAKASRPGSRERARDFFSEREESFDERRLASSDPRCLVRARCTSERNGSAHRKGPLEGARDSVRSAIKPVPVEQDLSQLVPAFDLIRIGLDDRAERRLPPGWRPVPDLRRLHEARSRSLMWSVTVRLLRRLVCSSWGPQPLQGDAQAYQATRTAGPVPQPSKARPRIEVSPLKLALCREVGPERRERRRGHGGHPVAPRGGLRAQLGEQSDGEFVHEVERLHHVSGRGGLDRGLQRALDGIERGIDLDLAADLDDAPEHEVLRVQALGRDPAALRGERDFLRRRAPRWPAVDRAQLSRMIELGAQKLDHAVTQVLVLAAARDIGLEDGDASYEGRTRAVGGREATRVPGGPGRPPEGRRAMRRRATGGRAKFDRLRSPAVP